MPEVDWRGAALGPIVEELSRRTGLDDSGWQGDRMADIVAAALREMRVQTPAEYLALLDRDTGAYAAVVDRLTVGETYFFRDASQMALARWVMRSWTATAGSRRLWSAGCASGEEPYTLAILLEEEGLLARSRVLGTDLSEGALDRARGATYGPWSLRRCSAAQRARYFHEECGRFRLDRRFVDAVQLRAANLLDGPPTAGPFDLVLCRNVLIYLSDEALQRAAVALRDALRPGGWLILGASDHLPTTEGLDVVRTGHGVAYRRSTGRHTPAESGRSRLDSGTTTSIAGHRRRPPSSRPQQTVAAPATPTVVRSEPPPSAEDTAAMIRAAADADTARGLLDAGLVRHPVDAGLRVLAATLHLGAGRHSDAVEAAGAAVYLEPDLAVAHLVLGRAYFLAGDAGRARRSFRNAHDLLTALPPDAEVPFADGERAGSLAATAATLAEG